MTVPPSLNIAISLTAFLVALFTYYRADPENRVLNPYFGLAIGAIVIAVINLILQDPRLSGWLFLLALAWCGLALYQLRKLPPRPEERP